MWENPLATIVVARRLSMKGCGDLLDFDLGTSSFELALKLISFFFADAFLKWARSAFDKLLGVGQAESRDSAAHFLNDSDLVAAVTLKDHVKFGFFFSCCATAVCGSCCDCCNRSCCTYAPLIFEGLYKVSDFQDGKSAEAFYDFVNVCHGIYLGIAVRLGRKSGLRAASAAPTRNLFWFCSGATWSPLRI